jgi:hypothetical protein
MEEELYDEEVKGEDSLEEQLSTEKAKPTKLNKNGKPRKQLSQDALDRLARAREKANAMRREGQLKKLEEKVEKIKIKNDGVLPKKELKEEPEKKELKEEPQEEELKEEKPKTKPKGKKKTKIIVEQSSDDSDEFEPNDNVVFVKRVSRKKKEVETPPIERQQAMELPPPEPPEPPKPPRPELTQQQKLLKSQYEGMFGGGFLRNNYMRNHY